MRPSAFDRDLAPFENRLAHIDRRAHHAAPIEPQRDRLEPASVSTTIGFARTSAALEREPREASDSVAAHVAAAAVGVVHLHPDVGVARRREHDQAVAADAEVPIGKLDRQRRRIGGTRAHRDDIDIVVAASMHLGEFERCHRAMRAHAVFRSTIFSPRTRSSKLSRSRITWTSAPSTRISGARGRLL